MELISLLLTMHDDQLVAVRVKHPLFHSYSFYRKGTALDLKLLLPASVLSLHIERVSFNLQTGVITIFCDRFEV